MKQIYLSSLFTIAVCFFSQCIVSQTITKNSFLGTAGNIVASNTTPMASPALTPDDTWGYTAQVSNGRINKTGANTLEIVNWWDNNAYITFNQVSLDGFTSVQFSIEYSSNGSPDNNEDLFLDYRYFDGGAWVDFSVTLIDAVNGTGDALNFGVAGALPNPYIVNIPDSATLFEATVRADEFQSASGGTGGQDTYYIDNISLTGTPPPNPTAQDDNLAVLKNSTSGVANQINVGSNDTIGSDGGDGDDYALNTTTSNGTVTEISDGVFEYIPTVGFIGSDSFTYNICDTTPDCATATVNISVSPNICQPTSNSNGSHFITGVVLNGDTTNINNSAGNADDGGYGNYLSLPAADLTRGTNYTIEVSVSNTAAAENRSGWVVYIDLNQDGDFIDAGEEVWNTVNVNPIGNGEDQSLSGTDNTFNPGNFTIPTTASLGTTIMRVGMRRYWYPADPCGQTGNPEEFEDYVIDIKNNVTTQDIDIYGNNNTILPGATLGDINSNNNTNFGFYDINSGVLEKIFVITNNGASNLTLSLPYVAVSGSAAFTVSDQPNNAVIAPGNSETFTIAFNPVTVGNFNTTVTVTSDDLVDPNFTFVVAGEGQQTFPDTDGDSVPDNIDLDDDNDGILDTTENTICSSYSTAITTEVVFLDETFGSGTTRTTIDGNTSGVTTTYCFEDGTGTCPTAVNSTSISDGQYTVHHIITNDDDIADDINTDITQWAEDYWYAGEDHTTGDVNGRMAIFNASIDPGVFYSQTISGVTPGVPVEFGLYAINIDRDDIDPTELAMRPRPIVEIRIFDPTGTQIAFATSDTPANTLNPTSPAGDWKEISASFTSGFTQFTVEISNNSPGGNGSDLAIDDIFIKQTLCDLDGDGVADSVDLDNDNDGIPNVVELGLADPDKDGTLFGTGWSDTNNNGVHDSYESGATLIDTDSDTVPNYLDLDSDNDGIFDAVEYDGNGDVDIDGDGFGDGNDFEDFKLKVDNDDNDNDGILPIIDGNDDDSDGNDFGTSAYLTPIDSDGDLIPNYLDVDSDDAPNDFSNGSDIDKTQVYAYLDANNDGVLDDTVDSDGDGILDIFDTDNTIFGSPRSLDDSYTLFFDGRNDYVSENSVIGAWANATLMAWIKIEPGASGDRLIVGQNNFHLLITSSGTLSAVANGNTLSGTTVLNTGVWIHVAATYTFDGTNGIFSVYVNGEQVNTNNSVTGDLPTDTSSLTIGRMPDTDANYFEGEIDEVRIFNEALTSIELQRMVYQELEEANTFNRGKIIPQDIDAANTFGTSLVRYFKMDTYRHDILDDKTTTAIDAGTGARMYNIKDIYFQTAPLPYETIADGAWGTESTWLHGDVWDIEDEANNKAWSIVHIKHNVTTASRHATLGLIIDPTTKLEVNGDSELQNSWYLSLNGTIDLQGESQLIQTETSTLVGSGNLERDQQGTENLYTYNYWSSPVHTSNPNSAIDGDEAYTVSSILRNAEDPNNPQAITWLDGDNYDGDATANPIAISDYWIWKFDNRQDDNYSLWQHVRSTGNLLVGEGYSMKGPGTGSIATDRNYVFTGTPNNGEITLTTNAGNNYLVGNPYPSAIDASEFLNDNPHLNGTLYFWEHYGGGSHILKEYEGGYGLYNYSGGVPPLNGSAATPDPDVSQTGSGSKVPTRYIPVGQGFFVVATSNGDTTFENDQRIFITEASSNSLFIKGKDSKANVKNTSTHSKDNRPKIRLGLTTPKGYKRQLLTTIDTRATMHDDWGFEGKQIETNVEDFYWIINSSPDNKYTIQAIDAIDKQQTVLPIGIKSVNTGLIEIGIDALENLTDGTEIYLKDNYKNLLHNLNKSKYTTLVEPGEIKDRFEIVFSQDLNTLTTSEKTLHQEIVQFYNSPEKALKISNPNGYTIKSIKVLNTLGQNVFSKNINSSNSTIAVPVNISTGMYISVIEVKGFKVNQKIIIN